MAMHDTNYPNRDQMSYNNNNNNKTPITILSVMQFVIATRSDPEMNTG